MLRKLKFAKIISTLWISLLLSACGNMPMPNSEFIRVIPFEPPEAVSIELVSRKKRLYTPAETEQLIPLLTCLTPEGVQEIIKKGKQQCRRDDSSCALKLETVRTQLEALDKIAESIISP